eukprot:4388177-Pyramimonas_sp.AAC.1
MRLWWHYFLSASGLPGTANVCCMWLLPRSRCRSESAGSVFAIRPERQRGAPGCEGCVSLHNQRVHRRSVVLVL